MKVKLRLSLILLVFPLFLTCDSQDQNIDVELLGEWQLVEILADPGDGSGTFRSIKSGKILEFKSDGTVTSNQELCNFTVQPNSADSGVYSLEEQTIEPFCNGSNRTIYFEKKNSELILSYLCIEGCNEKYIKREPFLPFDS